MGISIFKVGTIPAYELCHFLFLSSLNSLGESDGNRRRNEDGEGQRH